MRIIVFGDSITYGAWDPESGWVDRLRKELDKRNLSDPDAYYLIYNLGIDGDTSDGILKRFDNEVKPRLWPGEETVVIFALGTNDSAFVKDKQSQLVPPKRFKSNLRGLIKMARKYATRVVFIGPQTCTDSKTNPVPWKLDLSYRSDSMRKYNRLMKETCKSVMFIDLQSKIPNSARLLYDDGLHPNQAGHIKIFNVVKEYLIANRIL